MNSGRPARHLACPNRRAAIGFRQLAPHPLDNHIGKVMEHHLQPPSIEQMQLLAEQVVRTLPAQFLEHMGEIVLRVEEFATAKQLDSVGLSDQWQLSGLYEGVSIPHRSVWESGRMPARIWLFRRPLIAEWRATAVRMDDLIRHVVLHEAGHHFGFSDDDMHRLEDEGS